MKWTISVLMSCLILSGCVGIKTKTMPDSSKILVVSQTSNEYTLTHLSFNIFPSFRQAQSMVPDTDWTMTSLLNELVDKNASNSRFKFAYLSEPIPSFDDDKSLNAELMKLAIYNDADYVLVLQSANVPNSMKLKTQGGHYGYVHESAKGFSDIGRVYANIHVRLLDAKTLNKKLFKWRSCGRLESNVFVFQLTDKPLTLPDSLVNIDLKSVLVAEEVEKVIAATKALATTEIENAIFACKLDR